MNRTLTLALLTGLAGLAQIATAGAAPLDAESLARGVMPALVRVEYELQVDKADAPSGGLGNERCPNCGNYHVASLRTYLEEERPVEAAGFLVAGDQVVSVDPLFHPRFIKSITVRSRGQSSTAVPVGYARDQKAVMLKLDRPLSDAQPLAFAGKTNGGLRVVAYERESGRWVASVQEFPTRVTLAEGEPPHLLAALKGVAVNAAGAPVGVLLGSRVPLDDSWQGSPLEWAYLSAADVQAQHRQLATVCGAGLIRVRLSFRSPPGGDEMNPSSRFRGGMGDEREDEGTERNVLGVVLAPERVLVLSHLKPRVTARLERITLHPAEGAPVTAKFLGSLKDFGALVVVPEQALKGPLEVGDVVSPGLRDQLLLRADVSMQGETRAEYLHTARVGAWTVGARGRLYPALDEPESPGAFLFSTNRALLGLPVARRGQVSGDRSYGWREDEVQLTPARYVLEAVAGLPGTADLSNVPMSEEEENRLAWFGVELQPLTRDLARAHGVSAETRDGETGALVTYVHPDSPAAGAGIKPGAVLLRLKVPGQALPVEIQMEEDYSASQPFPWDRLDEVPEQYFDRIPRPWPSAENSFTRALTDLGVGTKFVADFFIDGVLVSKPFDVVAGPAHFDAAPRYTSGALGMTVRDMTYDVRRYLQRRPEDPGVVVSKLEAGSKASVAGMKPYELITHVNDQPVQNVKDFEQMVAAGGEMKLSVRRMARGRIVTIKTGG